MYVCTYLINAKIKWHVLCSCQKKKVCVMSVCIELAGYAKIILHCSKYPYEVIGGFLIGDLSSKRVVDAVPVFHGAPLANLLELGAELTEGSSKKIIGVYFCNERLGDTIVPGFVESIVKTIEANVGKGNCILGQVMQAAMNDKTKLCLKVISTLKRLPLFYLTHIFLFI